jgi:hypothetical protein
MQDGRAMELEAAREILAEVLGSGSRRLDDMIENRSHDGDKNTLKEADGLWPREQ